MGRISAGETERERERQRRREKRGGEGTSHYINSERKEDKEI